MLPDQIIVATWPDGWTLVRPLDPNRATELEREANKVIADGRYIGSSIELFLLDEQSKVVGVLESNMDISTRVILESFDLLLFLKAAEPKKIARKLWALAFSVSGPITGHDNIGWVNSFKIPLPWKAEVTDAVFRQLEHGVDPMHARSIAREAIVSTNAPGLDGFIHRMRFEKNGQQKVILTKEIAIYPPIPAALTPEARFLLHGRDTRGIEGWMAENRLLQMTSARRNSPSEALADVWLRAETLEDINALIERESDRPTYDSVTDTHFLLGEIPPAFALLPADCAEYYRES